MIFTLLPLLANAANITGHDRTDIKGRFWDTTYDCRQYYEDLDEWNDGDEDERNYCDAFSEWQQDCLADTNLDQDCYEYEYYTSCVTIWYDPSGYSCQDYLAYGFCTEEGDNLLLTRNKVYDISV